VLGEDNGKSPIHGDFAPWNSCVVGDGRLAVWDWEEARLGRPLEDIFHWRIQRYLRGAETSLAEIVGDALGPGPMTATAADRLGVDSESAPDALRQYLDETLGRPPRSNFPGVAKLRSEALGMMVVRP
jgi:aminoglycoside phosphotransferase (APT) family kinase protein